MKLDDIVCTSCFKYNYCRKYIESNRENVDSGEKCQNTLFPEPSSLRCCQSTICELYYTKFGNKDVLEVGCGTKEKGGLVKKIVENNRCKWIGIDIKKTSDLATHFCSVEHMPFEDNSFDCVIGSQTLEHWKKPRKALKEIRRVLRPEGKVYLTAPIHLHGGKMFVSGDFDSIEKLFLASGFNIEKIETWRKNYCDLMPCYSNDYAKKHLRKVGIFNYEGMTIYIIHCILTKKNRVRTGFLRRIFWQ